VDSAPPIVYARSNDLARPAIWGRLLALAIALSCLAVLLTAARLPPSHAGFGSHQALGLHGCQFLERTGLPCPSCGMTTSFTWFVRGNLAASLYVQPMGALLAALCCCTVWVGLYVAITGRPVYRMLQRIPAKLVMMPALGFALAAWAWKIFIHLSGHDGW
jgi:hypothetical protein